MSSETSPEEKEWASDPKIVKYEGDIKQALVDEIYANVHLLGEPTYRVAPDETHPHVLRGFWDPQPLNVSKDDIEAIVDRTVTHLIGELLEFNHRYNREEVMHDG